MQSLAQKSTSTTLPRRSVAFSGDCELIQPPASIGGNGQPTYGLAGLGRLACSVINVAAAATSNTIKLQNAAAEPLSAGAGAAIGCVSVANWKSPFSRPV